MSISFASSYGRVDGLFYLLVGGPIVLMWGLRKFNKKRLIQNTPLSKVRSAAMGLVELSGMARQRSAQKSPLSGMDACWWNCRVEEQRSNGKDTYWATIKQISSTDLFYLEDATGRVLVHPLGAEFHILNNTYELNSRTRTQMAPVLNGWGINDTNWFGGKKRMRIVEQLVPDCAPLFIMGELISVGNQPEDCKAKFLARLRAIKADPAKMAEADPNHDGAVDAEEWTAFEAKQEEEFINEEVSRQAQLPDEEKMLVKAPASSPFIISTQAEHELIGSFGWLAPLGIVGGIALSGSGVWLALMKSWNPLFIVGLLGAGFVASIFVKQLNFNRFIGRT